MNTMMKLIQLCHFTSATFKHLLFACHRGILASLWLNHLIQKRKIKYAIFWGNAAPPIKASRVEQRAHFIYRFRYLSITLSYMADAQCYSWMMLLLNTLVLKVKCSRNVFVAAVLLITEQTASFLNFWKMFLSNSNI